MGETNTALMDGTARAEAVKPVPRTRNPRSRKESQDLKENRRRGGLIGMVGELIDDLAHFDASKASAPNGTCQPPWTSSGLIEKYRLPPAGHPMAG